MGLLDTRFKVNDRDVIAETLDGEVIIINLNSGCYFSSDGIGGHVWEALGRRQSVGAIVEQLGALFPDSTAAIGEDVPAYVEQLCSEELILEATEPDGAQSGNGAHGAMAMSYARPVLHKYTDFQELLKLDPIHEVHESVGWPVANPSD
ncbi:MAG TPA: PqqD family protein [Dehalococcoidia bacterium]|nr:PqqD family protein [Dehalococcoidia bacterium]